MLYLPKTISSEIRLKYQRHLESGDLATVLEGLAEGTKELFQAQECLVVFGAESLMQPIVCFSGLDGDTSGTFNEDLWEAWRGAGIHEQLTKDLLKRLSAISYSAFSWPYARMQVEKSALMGERYAMPRDYTILMPISSDIIVRHQESAEFFGYIAVFFSVFPQISDDVVQLIVSLPGVVSEISSVLLES